ncbi:MAG TPA: sulfotransferase, partial [Woeseiaceae bacterium]|nr:sulfotransferase [Woeseiaceae bacterium]
MTRSREPAMSLARVRRLASAGRLGEAESACRELAGEAAHREAALREIADLCLQQQKVTEAVQALESLHALAPEVTEYCVRLATLLDALGHTERAISCYETWLERHPRDANAHYNLALLYKKNKCFDQALAAYGRAAELGIRDVQEVWSNMGVLYAELRQQDEARAMYQRALATAPGYIPARFNLAGLLEETGQRQEAIGQYERILAADPRHFDSLARIVFARTVSRDDDALIRRLNDALPQARGNDLAQEGLRFALGKAHDDRREYETAFAWYRSANELGRRRNRPYDAGAVEQAVDRLIAQCDEAWLAGASSGADAAPVFICGMLRSGSTLVEQILSAHPAVAAGGELDILPWLLARRLTPYPQRLATVSGRDLAALADEYLEHQHRIVSDRPCVTDKRPDNFLHLGLLKAMFPAVRIVYTRRNPLDNCLSVFFQQLGGNLNYATDLSATGHYYRQHERLMQHWISVLGGNIFTVDYDEL